MTLEQQESADPDAATSPRVFITHSHDDEHHKRSVREFAEVLQLEGGVRVELRFNRPQPRRGA
jgi:hypothetical protein